MFVLFELTSLVFCITLVANPIHPLMDSCVCIVRALRLWGFVLANPIHPLMDSYVCIVRTLRRFQQFFSRIATVSGCGRKLNAHFKSGALLTYHTPDTRHDIPPSHIV